ncbi:hypothetical protein [Halalkalirubrum salinum]|uniref:hypothetical protein n=1 Tax=Halalkalirubrum salinum TaxID=2563889 RepID=UPI0010FB97AD|nr:hypothetical protein [Halalkalirubrum salinum]
MALSCRIHILGALILWMSAIFGVLVFFRAFSFESYFVLSFIGLLIVIQLFAPVEERPAWWQYIRMTTAAGFVVFGYILYRQITAVL